jgi:hypothetical protein
VPDCLFCKIIEGTIPAAIVYQDDQVVAFKDINGQAPMHVLIVRSSARWSAARRQSLRRTATARQGIGPCSTATLTQARPSSTSICMCLADVD